MQKEGISDLIQPKDVLVFADKCKEINRQYMLNNNAELDNGVYNENEVAPAKAASPDKKAAKDDGLMGLNVQMENLEMGADSSPMKFDSNN